jgi:hypothetical protein
MTKKSNTPKRKRLRKQERLNSALEWIKGYDGKNIISGYAKWFGVDEICAIIELKTIGTSIPEQIEKQIIDSHNARIEQKRIDKENRKKRDDISVIDSDDDFAYIVGYTPGGFPYGLTHDEYKIMLSEDKIHESPTHVRK